MTAPEALARTDAQRPLGIYPHTGQVVAHRIDILQDGARPSIDRFAIGRERHAARRAVQQPHAKGLFKQGNALTDVRLRIAELVCGRHETQPARDFAEQAEIAEYRFIKHDLVIMECRIK
ncbi:hypothetical protein YK56LOC_33920 [Caballeronia sp. HLA56]